MMIRALLLLVWLLPAAALAEAYPEPRSDTVSDFADLLPEAAEGRLTERLRAIRKETGVHLVVVTLPRRAGNGPKGAGLESFATGLFNTWGIGDAARNDGVMILVLPEDREMRLELGAGFPGAFDAMAASVVADSFLPAFRSGNYAKGIETGTEATITRIIRPFAKGAAPGKTSPPARLIEPRGEFADPLLIGLFVMAALLVKLRQWLGDQLVVFRRCRICGKRALERSRVTLTLASEDAEGRAEVTTRCTACGDSQTEVVALPRFTRDRSSGGGGGGFGGGRSSGGGASGRF